MPDTTFQTASFPMLTDPLAAFLNSALARRAPTPAMRTRYEALLEAGLAVVTTTRSFKNDEDQPIEATLTFPVPVHATVFEMTAQIGERRLKAKAQARARARETYEGAIERGKAAVLHEELLKGVHMLSVGQVAPGEEVEATAVWCLPMSAVDGEARLRIPLTVGDVYGRSGLADSDALIHGAPASTGWLAVRCAEGAVTVNGAAIGEDAIEIPLNRPIDLACALTPPRALQGRAADGRGVTLRIAPRESQDAALHCALLLDHSGSMGERFSIDGRMMTKHQAAIMGLSIASEDLAEADSVDLWEFDHGVQRVSAAVDGLSPHDALKRRLTALSPPAGGTEIGGAIQTVFRAIKDADILLITDGKSHALDPQRLAQEGRRVSVVLIGEDSLEAAVGHLAALTGGEVFIASAETLGETLMEAVESLRSEALPRPRIAEAPQALIRILGGMEISAEWRSDAEPVEGPLSRAAAAFAAMLALPAMEEAEAAALAEAEGLVSHLTSLVLVDEAGATQDGLPAYRKVPLPSPATASMDFLMAEPMAECSMRPVERVSMRRVAQSVAPREFGASRHRRDRSFMAEETAHEAVGPIDWENRPDLLRKGDLSMLSRTEGMRVRLMAEAPALRALAETLKLDPVVLALALIARAASGGAPGAGKFARLLLGNADPTELDRVSRKLGL